MTRHIWLTHRKDRITTFTVLLVALLLTAYECAQCQEHGSILKERDQAARSRQFGAATVCSRYDSPAKIVVADDWRSAKVNTSDRFGLMHCEESKDVFRTCAGPQVPDAGLSAIFTRTGDKISVRLIGESISGPHELAHLDCWHFVTGEPLPRDPKTFALEYSLIGGPVPLNRHMRLTQAGELDVSANSPGYGSHISTQASPLLMARIVEFLKVAQESRLAADLIKPDAINTSLALISGGSRYDLQVPEQVAMLLGDTIDTTLKKALLGDWRESEWKLCRPTSQLTAEQMDTPIASLVFQDNDHFSVTWRGGGARIYGDPSRKGVPHTQLPDYSGRYQIQPDRGHIQLTFESGIYHPRDFVGDGFFQINGDKLTLKGVWLGTYRARQKPDICELTFTPISE